MIAFLRASVLTLAFALGAGSGAQAACDTSAWPLTQESAALETAGEAIPNGAPVEPGQAKAIRLVPLADAGLPLSPQRPPKAADAFAGYVTFTAPKPGLYQVTLSHAAWIDVVQHGALVPSGAFTSAQSCPGVRKSVRFSLEAAPAVIQFSDAANPIIRFIFSPVEQAPPAAR